MTELQQLCHYNMLDHSNARKTSLHEYMATQLQLCIDEIISGINPTDSIGTFVLSQITFLFQTVLEKTWLLTEFTTVLKPVMELLTIYVRKNFEIGTEIYILTERYNSLQELEDGG